MYANLFPKDDEGDEALYSRGTGDLKKLIFSLNERAKAVLEEEDKRRLSNIRRRGSESDHGRGASERGGDSVEDKGEHRGKRNDLMLLDDEVFQRCNLTALVKARYLDVAVELDKDFDLSHEQLIKALKVIMYQIYLMSKRQDYRHEELQKEVVCAKSANSQLVNHSVNQMTAFIGTL